MATLSTARKVLPYFAEYEEVWKSVNPKKLDKYGKKAHAHFVKLVIKIIKAKRADDDNKDSEDNDAKDDEMKDDKDDDSDYSVTKDDQID